MGPSSAGAIGWMQFLPSTWERWGLDADGDGLANPWNPDDAVFAAARYLAAAGGHEDVARAVFAYNHSDEYVRDVLALAAGGDLGDGFDPADPWGGAFQLPRFFTPDIDALIDQAGDDVREASAALEAAESRADELEWRILAAEQAAGDAEVGAARFLELDRLVSALGRARLRAQRAAELRRVDLRDARTRLRALRRQAGVVSFSTSEAPGVPGVGTAGGQAALGWAISHVGLFGYSQGPTTDRGGDVFAMQTLQPAGPTCDCSSFVRWSMAQAGIDVGLTTVQQWPANGLLPDDETAADTPVVSRGVGADPPSGGYVPGDLVFWGHGGGSAGHVAIYLGGGLIVQCSSGVGSGIRALAGYGAPTGWVRWHAVTGTVPFAWGGGSPFATSARTVAVASATGAARVFTPVQSVFTVVGDSVVAFTR